MGKPRQTQRDKWAKRPAVMRYRAYADQLRLLFWRKPPNVYPTIISWCAYFSIPESWSRKKKEEMKGKPHKVRPDRDNVDKGILDALFKSDSHVWSGHIEKRWDDGKGARIEISYD